MKNMTLANIAQCLNSPLCRGEGKEQNLIKGAVLDSRKLSEGYLFFATRGERADGHNFIPQVAEKGAALVVCEEAPNVDIPYILVEDSFQALKQVAAFYRAQLDIPVIGVTGSVGKTSTKEMIAACLGNRFQVLKTEGNFNNEVGLPLTILSIRDCHQAAVVEMGISDFEEMHRLSAIARPDICVITNIGQCHLENLVDRDGVLKAKTEMFDFMNPNGYVVLNGEDDKLATVQKVHGRRPYFFGMDEDGLVTKDVYAKSVLSRGLFGSAFQMQLFGETLDATVPLPGRHMVMNAMAAAAVGHILGMSSKEILDGIASVKATGGRSNIVALPDKTIIDDCYNANPASMRSAIDLLKMAEGPKTVILGDMFELGAEERLLHLEIGHYTALARLEEMIFIGTLAREMYNGAVKLRAVPAYYPDKESFFMAHKPEDFVGKTVLVKASHGMHFEEIVGWLKETEATKDRR